MKYWKLTSWIVFYIILLFLAQREHDYYLESDINGFKKDLLTKFLMWTGIAIGLAAVIFAIVRIRSFKRGYIFVLKAVALTAFYLFAFHSLFLGACLFLNRQFKQGSEKRIYVASFMVGAEETKDYFHLYDPVNKQTVHERKLEDRLYNPAVHQFDTLRLEFGKGFLGIAFQAKAFRDD